MVLNFEARLSDSPFVERVWRSHSERGGPFVSIAATNFEVAVSRLEGRTFLTLRGPETKATTIVCPPGGEWLGIRFRLGTFMPRLTPEQLRDHNDVTLPDASSRSFWLHGSPWEYPDFDNAEEFVARLAAKGIIAREPAVERVMRNEQPTRSLRTAQRHFLRATGLTHSTVQKIERARYATNLLRQGTSILDTVHEAGYFDQAHLARSLKHLVGQTPVEIGLGTAQLSFLYKTPRQP